MSKHLSIFFVVLLTILFPARAEVADFQELQQFLDAVWEDPYMARLHPPGAEFNEVVPRILLGATFPSDFFEDLVPQTRYGVDFYTLKI